MRHAIIEKLNKELSKPTETEAQVVYLLVEMRKVINEHDASSDTKYPILSFFCDWVVHTKLDRRGAKSMLNVIQGYYANLDGYLHIRKTTNFFPFVVLMVLRRELKLFLKRNDMPAEIVDKEDQWIKFLFLLIDVIIDSPLISNEGYIREFRYIEDGRKGVIKCELKLQSGETQPFVATNKSDFLETDYASFMEGADK